ncbi:MAG: heme exporter protein CcmB [Acidimicrobiales bacterium]
MWRDALLVAGKDLRLELRSRVVLNQVAPFAVLVLVLFAFALDPARGVLARAAPGLYWLAVLFAALLAIHRAFAVEAADANRDALRLSGMDPAAIFLGKALAVGAQLLALEALLAVGVALLYDAEAQSLALAGAACLAATLGLTAAGVIYGALAAGLRVRETLLPLLLLPALSPVLIGATRAFEAALRFPPTVGLVGGAEAGGLDAGASPAEGWPWLGLLAVFAAVYAVIGILAFGALLEES